MMSVNPYLNFAGNTQEAFDFYRSVFGGEFQMIVRFREMGGEQMNIPAEDLDKIAHIALPIGSAMLMGTDTLESLGQKLNVGNNTFFVLEIENSGEADRIFHALGDGGTIAMPLDETEWAEKYGICTDRFGIQWMISYTGNKTFGS